MLSILGSDFKVRVKRKIKRTFERYFIYNSKFKPKGVYQTAKEYFNSNPKQGIEFFEIYSGYESHLPMSQELYDSCSEYAKPSLSVKTDYVVVKVPNGRLYTDNMGSIAIIGHDQKLVGDVSFQYKDGDNVDPRENLIFHQSYFIPPLKLPGTVFSMLSGGGAINNYGHWLMDALPRFHLLKESGLLDTVDWFLIPSMRYDFQRDAVKLLGIPTNKIIEGDKIRHIQADNLIATTAPRGKHVLIPEWSFRFIRDTYVAAADPKPLYPPLVHISRKDSSFRNVLNEDEMVEILEPYGFANIILSKLSLLEKVNLFHHADVVIGASGAGLTNLFFSKEGGKLIELFSEGFVLTDYIDLAKHSKVEHHYVISPALSDVRNKKQGQRDHMTIDLKKLKKVLEEVMVPQV
jgi:capsular polysaccharide biosynthesis protein